MTAIQVNAPMVMGDMMLWRASRLCGCYVYDKNSVQLIVDKTRKSNFDKFDA